MEEPGAWVIRDIPRSLMRRMRIAAAVQETSVKQLLMDLSEAHLKDLERQGLLPKAKGKGPGIG